MTSNLHHHFPNIADPDARCTRCNLKLEFLSTDSVIGFVPPCAPGRVEAIAGIITEVVRDGIETAARLYDEKIQVEADIVLATLANYSAKIAIDGKMSKAAFIRLMLEAFDGMEQDPETDPDR